MATAGDGRAPYDSGGDGEKFRKRLLRPEINEDPQIVSQVAGQNEGRNLASIYVTVGKSELEQMLKQMTFTRSEAERLIALVHSRIMEESPSSKRHKHRDDNFHASIVGSEVGKEQIAELREPRLALLQQAASMEDLPDEVLSNIFIRLLSKQLAKMKCVSKSWNALLSQSSFIKSHLHGSIHNNNNNDQILLVFNYGGFDICLSPIWV